MSSHLWPTLTARLSNSRLARWFRYDHTLVVYRRGRSLQDQYFARSPRVRRDDWSQLERFESTERWLTRADFLRICEQRLDAGEHVYSIAEDRRLMAYGWLVPRQERSWFPAVQQDLVYPDRASVMYNAYTHPAARGRGLHTLLVNERIAEGFDAFGADAVYTAVSERNHVARRAKASSRMEPWLALGCRTRFGRTQVSRQPLGGHEAQAPAPSAAPT